jgi:outer membrane phospholipase A
MTAWAFFKNEHRQNSKVGFEHKSNRKTHNRKKNRRRKRMKSCGMTKTDRGQACLLDDPHRVETSEEEE